MALALNNLKKSWYAIKQRNQTKPDHCWTLLQYLVDASLQHVYHVTEVVQAMEGTRCG